MSTLFIHHQNATYKQIDGTIGSYTTTKDIFEKELHAYTITHAIDDRNVLRFHIDYLGVSGDEQASKTNETQRKKAVIEKILSKHDAVTNNRMILSILVYTFFSRMFDLMLPPVAKHSIVVA